MKRVDSGAEVEGEAEVESTPKGWKMECSRLRLK